MEKLKEIKKLNPKAILRVNKNNVLQEKVAGVWFSLGNIDIIYSDVITLGLNKVFSREFDKALAV